MPDKLKREDLFKRIDLGVRRGVARALAEHKRDGRSIFVSDGKRGVLEIPSEDIEIPEEFAAEFAAELAKSIR